MKIRRHLTCFAFGAVLGCALPAFAQDQPDEATRTAARALGTSGVEAFQAGDYAAATDKLEKAYGILRVPTLGLWSARALEKVGKWVEAADRYSEVTSLQVPAGEYAVQKQAQTEAQSELAALRAKIPVIIVQAEGANLADTQIAIDGQAVASTLAAEGRLVNPGAHVVEGKHGGQTARAEVQAAEGKRETVVLRFSGPAPAVAPAGVDGTAAPAGDERVTDSSSLSTFGWIGIVAGGAGVALGTVTGLIAVDRKSQFEGNANCVADACAPSQRSKVDFYNSMRTVSTIGFVAGGILAAAGVTLLVASSADSRTEAFVTPSSAGIRGTF